MVEGIQKLALQLGKTGCYVLSIAYRAQDFGFPPDGNILGRVREMVDARILDTDLTVLDAGSVMKHLTGMPWTCLKAGLGCDSYGNKYPLPLDYELEPNEFEILRFERPLKPGEAKSADTAHFVCGYGYGPMNRDRIMWDSWPDSDTVRIGRLVSRRIFRRV